MQLQRIFKRYSGFLVGYCILTILWGAFVRISGSGNGCGEHWPLCQGILIPESALLKTWIEFFHRIKSGLFGIFIVIQTILAFRWYPKGIVRTLATLTLVVTIVEALLGALLVIGGYVDTDASVSRLIVMTLHLINTLILLGLLTLLWQSTSCKTPSYSAPARPYCFIIFIFLFLAITGAWAALSSTLFPSESLHGGLIDDFSSTSHLLVRLRIIHPLSAIFFGAVVFYLSSLVQHTLDRKRFLACFAVHLLIGMTTLLTLSPTILKIVHLFTADLSWVLLLISSGIISERKVV